MFYGGEGVRLCVFCLLDVFSADRCALTSPSWGEGDLERGTVWNYDKLKVYIVLGWRGRVKEGTGRQKG